MWLRIIFIGIFVINSLLSFSYKIKFKSERILTSKDGYLLNSPQLSIDSNGLIWLFGLSQNNSTYQLFDNQHTLQVYDGTRIKTIKLPDTRDVNYSFQFLIQSNDNRFFYLMTGEENNLYEINQIGFSTKKLEKISQLIENADHVHIYAKQAINYLWKVENGESILYTFTTDNDIQVVHKFNHPYFPFMVEMIGSKLLYRTQTRKKQLRYYDLNTSEDGLVTYENGEAVIEKQIRSFVRKNSTYIITEDLYLFDSSKNKLVSQNDFSLENPQNITAISRDLKNNLMFTYLKNGEYQLAVLLNDEIKAKELSKKFKTKLTVTSRDFSREVIATTNNQIQHSYLSKDIIKTYLKDYGIRNILELKDNTYIISTEFNGWFILDLVNETTEFLSVKDQTGKLYNLNYCRGLFQDGDVIWSNSWEEIISYNLKTKELNTYSYTRFDCSEPIGNKIYYGKSDGGLFSFNRTTKEFESLNIESKIYSIKEFKGKIYGATKEGLIEYSEQENQLELYKTNKNDELITITIDKELGLLACSKNGRIYQFNPQNNKFSLLYEDAHKASIVGIIRDENNLWLNTFAGVVKYDLTTKRSKQYSERDGLSHFEGNRYSSYKTNNNLLMFGTVKGLNIFDPNKIKQTQNNFQPTVKSISYYNVKTKKWTTEYRSNLTSRKKITLPPNNHQMSLDLGFTDIVNVDDIVLNYRLIGENRRASQWLQVPLNNTIHFPNLSSGHYKLEIQAKTRSLEPLGEIIQLDIHSKNLLYQKTPFLILLTLIGLGFLFNGINAQRKNQIVQKENAKKLLLAQEDERSRIAKDLHDSVGQNLLLIKNALFTENKDTELINRTIDELRSITYNLHPFRFQQQGLLDSIKGIVDYLQSHSDKFYSYDVEIESLDFPEDTGIIIYRMIQECLSNTEKHSEASACLVKINQLENHIEFIIKDNGKGFNIPENKEKLNSLGMKTLQERAELIKASLELKSNENEGTTISFKVPTSKK